MNVLDIFSGIGGFSLGLERAGMRTVAFCECEPYCRAVLRKHWPDVRCYPDVRTLSRARLAADGIIAADVADATGIRCDGSAPFAGISGAREDKGRLQESARRSIDVICGGFPCQDVSVAGKGAGLAGERSGLWREFARLVGELRPRFAIVENVSALCSRGLGAVLGDLAEIGYDAEWHCIPACAVGAPHRRDRVWIVAYASGAELRHEPTRRSGQNGADPAELGNDGAQGAVADADSRRFNGQRESERSDEQSTRRSVPDGCRLDWRLDDAEIASQWLTEPDVGRVAHGVPARVDRLRSLGNAVVPQVVEIIGRAIMSLEFQQQRRGAHAEQRSHSETGADRRMSEARGINSR